MPVEKAVTLSEAASVLGVSPQRVNQLLNLGDLTGPDVGPGRARKHAPRVWESSLRQELTKRQAGRRRRAGRALADPSGEVSKPSGSDKEARPPAREGGALEAALRMKLRLDAAREALRVERQANKRLVGIIAATAAELQVAQAQADRLDDVAAGYSEALTQFLIPDSP